MQTKTLSKLVASALILVCLGACQHTKDSVSESPPESLSANSASPTGLPALPSRIHVNQLGFLPKDTKQAVVVGGQTTSFRVYNWPDRQQVMVGKMSEKRLWPLSGEEVATIDFSQVTQTGEYFIELADGTRSATFSIGQLALAKVHDAALKAYYFNRASVALGAEHAGPWARAMGHPDTEVMIHASAASELRPTGSMISAPKGWYDAGDYGKYVVNSGISTYTLLLAYRHMPQFYQTRSLAIPESSDTVPDILNEISWNLAWLEAMQDPNDGGVYHKLTTLNFAPAVMPSEAQAQRYVMQKSTAAALNFAAVMALASDVYADFAEHFPGHSQRYKQAALQAWQWAKTHPQQIYQQPADVKTGAYGDKNLNDEFAFAAAQLFVLTGEGRFLQEFDDLAPTLSVPSWNNTAGLAYYALLEAPLTALGKQHQQKLEQQWSNMTAEIVEQYSASAYHVPMLVSDFVWGSNAVAMNKAMLLLIANRHVKQAQIREAAVALLDYVLGRNPTGYAYVTGFGDKSPMHIHHRPSQADQVLEPVPGWLAGGAQNGWQDKCAYPSSTPAGSYLDDFCSYSTNEIAINWNAPLVYVLAALQTQ
ncbi:MAG: cellulase [Paraglaciecola sp.]|nr:cellulase [Paraglaciecola sp.]NCT48500.1 cellulase [Paraglaciecola sp.]